MNMLNKKRLVEHLTVCIELAEAKEQSQVAAVLHNLKREVTAGEFDRIPDSNLVEEE